VLPVVDMPGMPPHGPATPVAAGVVSIPGKAFAPRDLVVLIGQRVTWRNEDTSTHDVVSRSGGFASGFLSPGASYAFTPSVGGEFPYVCSIHPQMQGRLRVYGLPLEAVPARAAGRPTVLRGVAPSVGAEVVLSRLSGGDWVRVTSAPAGDAGQFSFAVRPAVPTTYRAEVGDRSSAGVAVRVVPRVTLRSRRGTPRRLLGSVAPANPGARVVLERYVRERFTWVAVRHGRLDRGSRVTFVVRPATRQRLRLRVVASRGYADGRSAAVVVRPD
jgi:plastocyanin